ncbi:hypothetical protein [Taibaiella helva]|uniref:hypothetical protein n=1 Tax=Taibaiella helva TaxID=2301235 RepID=UPI000E5968A2|nr:hypothetical protein [Taibaiella helva]
MRKSFLGLIIVIAISCNNSIEKEEAREKLQKALKTSISDNIEITDIKVTSAMGGDYTESFNVHFRKEEFCEILNKLKLRPCSGDSSAYCFEYKTLNGKHEYLTSVSFYPQRLIVNYFYIEE